MLKRQVSYGLLVGFAAVMVVRLMADDPVTRLAHMQDFSATQQALRSLVLFPELTDPAQVDGMEVLDVTTGKGILVVRDDSGLWYAPTIADIQPSIAAEEIDQTLVENAAAAIMLLAAQQTYDATPDTLERFGLQPEPVYKFRFRMRDATGQVAETTIDIGDTNPENVAYYVYVNMTSDENQRVYLVQKQAVDYLLTMLTESLRVEPALDGSPMDSEAATPVP